MSNAPNRYEKFVVPDGVKKIAFEIDTKVANAGTFVLQREDHTIGNLLRMQLHEDNDVTFAGYKIPHPLEYQMLVKVATNGRKSPQAAMQRAMERLKTEIRTIQLDFSNAAEKRERE